MQQLDLDLFPDVWNPPDEFARLRQLRGLPLHGIGRSCKVGKEEIIGLLVALERFAATDDAARHNAWHDILRSIVAAADGTSVQLAIVDRAMPLLELRTPNTIALAARLAAHDPPIHCSMGRREENVLVISPAALTMDQATIIGAALRAI
jgi:L-seryl-tRNA(Ser) seleniumtransferase